MARTIQPRSGRQAGIGNFLGLLANAIFWLALAIVLPLRAIVEEVPALAPYASWAPILFYALAFWSFVRALRQVPRLAARRRSAPGGPQPTSASREPRPAKSGGRSGLPARRAPTVQRMR